MISVTIKKGIEALWKSREGFSACGKEKQNILKDNLSLIKNYEKERLIII